MEKEKNIDFENFPVAGIRLGVACAGIKKENHRDLVLIEIAENSCTAAVFTQNSFCAAPVIISKKHLAVTQPRYLLVNTGNANAGTGEQGINDAEYCCEMVAEATSVSAAEVLPFSTGVIGEFLPVAKFSNAIKTAYENLSEKNWQDAAHGILTTDTVAKGFTRTLIINKQTITISGIAKGSGMIRPDMATMLAYIATDAKIGQQLLEKSLLEAVNHS
ncbi:MAG: bifunctional ornithine acetyltransferase/N-acetylglutamate synthase, partial [Gammaproteobacteria bacterium]|nr:bifunctional ornithine acetyltransferase/N-acetylglutamate synthase [Gammaproteobacteria bacterium]